MHAKLPVAVNRAENKTMLRTPPVDVDRTSYPTGFANPHTFELNAAVDSPHGFLVFLNLTPSR